MRRRRRKRGRKTDIGEPVRIRFVGVVVRLRAEERIEIALLHLEERGVGIDDE